MNAKGKERELEYRKVQHKQLLEKISRTEKRLLAEERPVGCGGRLFAFLFGGSGQTKVQTVDQAVFGVQSANPATDRLAKATTSMEAHVENLAKKVELARTQAKGLSAAGKRSEALSALKRAKVHQKALDTAIATHAALERQVDVLAESELQKQVAHALTSSVAVAKKKTKGLLSKTEDAVDGAIELRDFAEDVSQSLAGLQTDAYDDDELIAELEAMGAEDDSKDALKIQEAEAEPAPSYPAAPTKPMEQLMQSAEM